MEAINIAPKEIRKTMKTLALIGGIWLFIWRLPEFILLMKGTTILEWVHQFVIWYNTEHCCHSWIQFVTPERWENRATRNWQSVEMVWLNPSKVSVELENNIEFPA